MKKYNFIMAFCLLFVFSASITAQRPLRELTVLDGKQIKHASWKNREAHYVAGELVVKIDRKTAQNQLNDFLKDSRINVIREFDEFGWGLVKLPPGANEFESIKMLEKYSFVLSTEPHLIGELQTDPNDPYFKGISPATFPHQWALKNTGQNPPGGTSGADINVTPAWDITTGNSDVIIIILDTGIAMQNGQLSHPDLNDANKFILGPDYAYDGNGVMDESGHGTHVTGIAGAESNNGTGITGVAWKAKMMTIQVIQANANYYLSRLYQALVYISNYQASNPNKRIVLNFSGGSTSSTNDVEYGVSLTNNEGIVLVASAGNDCGNDVRYPAYYSWKYNNVIAVSATNQDDVFSEYSSEGDNVSISAPGGHGTTGYCSSGNIYYDGDDIYSTTPNYSFAFQTYHPEITQNYGYMAGTSMSAPHVSGVAALVLSINATLTPAQVRTILQNSADWKAYMGSQPPSDKYGWGRLNAYEALKYTIANYGAHLGVEKSQVTIPLWSNLALKEDVSLESGSNLTIEANNTVTISSVSGTVTIGGSGTPKLASFNGDTNGEEDTEAQNSKPREFQLSQNYPNPFNPSTVIRYQLPVNSEVRLAVYDMLGREVAVLVNGTMSSGVHEVTFDASSLSSGIYLYRLTTRDQTISKKMMLVK